MSRYWFQMVFLHKALLPNYQTGPQKLTIQSHLTNIDNFMVLVTQWGFFC